MACIVCGSADIRMPRAAGSVGALDFGSRRKDVWRPMMAVCRACGLGWQSPAPSKEELEHAYAALQDDVYVAEAENRRKAFRRSVRLLEGRSNRPTRRLLDVGCSAGFFLEAANDAGWDVWGVEPSLWLSGLARGRFGARVFTGSFESAPFERGQFDAVTMWDVLEHVPEPPAFVARAAAVLAPNGLLALNVPCRDSAIARLLGARWPLLLPEHLYYFSRASLKTLLVAAGFEVLGFWAHPVFFSADYVARRLRQHGWPLAGPPQWMERISVPLLMGERTVLARRVPHAAAPAGGDARVCRSA